MRAAIPIMLEQDLLTSKNLVARMANDQSGAYQSGASEALRTTVEVRNRQINLNATITSLATQQNRKIIRAEGPSSGDLVRTVNAFAKQLDAAAAAFSTSNTQALQAFTAGAETNNFQTRINLLSNAIRIDPAFGLAYLALAETLTQAGQDAAPVVASAASHRAGFTPLDRARFDIVAAQVTHAPLTRQEEAARRVLQLAPNQLDALAALGSARFLQGDAEGGEQALNRALQLSPQNANLQQQLALGLLETRQFTAAEKILLGIDNNPQILPQLAICILLEGDINRADIVFNGYLALRPPNDPVGTLFHAIWLAISGRMPNAISSLAGANIADPSLHPFAVSQLATWQLIAGDRAAAVKTAAAAQLDRIPSPYAAAALFVIRGNAPPAQWREQVNAFSPNEGVRQTILGYGLFLNGHYAEAAQTWQQIVQKTGGADLRARTMLAASLDRAGRFADAAKAGAQPFVPDFSDLFAAVSFGEMRRLLGLHLR